MTIKNLQNKISNKTPYELRFELLSLAKDTLEAEFHTKYDQYRWALESNRQPPFDIPKYPSKIEIFKLANEYKEFVENK